MQRRARTWSRGRSPWPRAGFSRFRPVCPCQGLAWGSLRAAPRAIRAHFVGSTHPPSSSPIGRKAFVVVAVRRWVPQRGTPAATAAQDAHVPHQGGCSNRVVVLYSICVYGDALSPL
eukprot:1348106-Prymnesium_polylepis.2